MVSQHIDTITCFGIGETSSLIVTGSRDTTVCVWTVKETSNKPKNFRLSKKPKHILRYEIYLYLRNKV